MCERERGREQEGEREREGSWPKGKGVSKGTIIMKKKSFRLQLYVLFII